MATTRRILFGRFDRAEDVVWAGVFLAFDEFSWITGTTFVIDGGITVNERPAGAAPRRLR